MTDNAIQSVDKALVAKRFAHARNTYSREARVQQQVAEKMLRLLMEHTGAATAVHNSTDPAQSRLRNTTPFAISRNSDAARDAIPACCSIPCNRKLCCSTTCVPKWKNV